MLTDTPQATETPPATNPEILPPRGADPTPEETTPPDAAESAATPTEAQDAPKTEAANFRDAWRAMSPKERAEYVRETWDEDIRGSDWLQGKTGAAKQRSAREQAEYDKSIADAAVAAYQKTLEDQRLDEATDSDDAYAVLEIQKNRKAARTAAEQRGLTEQQDAVRLEQYAGSRLGQVAVAAFEKLPEAVQAVLKAPDGTFTRRWGEATDTPETGLALAIQTAISAGIEAGLKDPERVKGLRKEIEDAVRAEAGIQKVASTPSPDTRGSAAEAATDDTQFLRDYAAGRTNDHARFRQLEKRGFV